MYLPSLVLSTSSFLFSFSCRSFPDLVVGWMINDRAEELTLIGILVLGFDIRGTSNISGL